MCSQYSAAEFPQRGDNPGNLAGFDPARVAGSRAADSSGRQGEDLNLPNAALRHEAW